MEIKQSGSQPSQKAPAEHFTGAVRIDSLFQTSKPAGAAVDAQRGAGSRGAEAGGRGRDEERGKEKKGERGEKGEGEEKKERKGKGRGKKGGGGEGQGELFG